MRIDGGDTIESRWKSSPCETRGEIVVACMELKRGR